MLEVRGLTFAKAMEEMEPLGVGSYKMVRWNPATTLDPNKAEDRTKIYIIEQKPEPGTRFKPSEGVTLTYGSAADLEEYRNPTTTTTTTTTPSTTEATTMVPSTTEPDPTEPEEP